LKKTQKILKNPRHTKCLKNVKIKLEMYSTRTGLIDLNQAMKIMI